MFYRLRRSMNVKRFDRMIAGILETKPLVLEDAPWAIVSMVAKRDVPMYLVAMKSFYPKIGRGKIVAIIDRDTPQILRDTLTAHLVGIEFAILEDIPTDSCQRGGTWERLLYCLDRSVTEYTIQLDADTLTMSKDLQEVVDCVQANQAFTMADGFARISLSEAAELAQATPSNYIGIASEAMFDRYPGKESLHYVRGSSGFAGFAKGGFTRAAIAKFHQEMEKLVGSERWREWGSEQCGSNFAVANSPDPLVLPYPDYASFDDHVPTWLRPRVKLFHFIGAYRFKENYYARKSQNVIAALQGRIAVLPASPQRERENFGNRLPLLFARNLTMGSMARYLWWRLSGRFYTIVVQMRTRSEIHSYPGAAPKFMLRGSGTKNGDFGVAYEIFVHCLYAPPVWIPRVRVKLIVDLGANVGMSCLWWLSNYWCAHLIAFEPHPHHAEAARANFALNNFSSRIEFYQSAVGPEAMTAHLSDEGSSSRILANGKAGFQVQVMDLFEFLAGRRIDILKMDIESSEVELLADPRFALLDIGTVVMEWHSVDEDGRGGRDWCSDRLQACGFRTYVTSERGACGLVWGYRDYGRAAGIEAEAAFASGNVVPGGANR
jgi:FkbM family methyltransferase